LFNQNATVPADTSLVVIDSKTPIDIKLPTTDGKAVVPGAVTKTQVITVRSTNGTGVAHTILPATGNTINGMLNSYLLSGNNAVTLYAVGNTWYSSQS
jgi:Na+-transporting NADH:ubiquinone oxidoreductase subunit NqrC